jgi:hypothetical protein
MGPEQVRKAHHAQPFRPFIIHMGNGRQVRVDHPKFMAVSPTGRYALVWLAEDRWEEIELFLGTSLEFPSKSNGSRKKK